MDAAKEKTFVKLMTIDIVGEHILKYVVKISGIKNLAKTCKSLCLSIRGDLIGRDIFWLRDYQFLTVRCKRGFKKAYEVPIVESVNITEEKYDFKKLRKEHDIVSKQLPKKIK
uniref:F-box domain-containing protein n=1 Tax=Strongyloides venezuelensis TaxID=75913 RepID=A0A0K0G068_STRVS